MSLPPAAAAPPRLRSRSGEVAPVMVWMGTVGVALAVGTLVVARWSAAGLAAAPLDGRWDWRPGPALLPALIVGGAAIAWGPALSIRLSWRALVAAAATTTVGWSLALAGADGLSRVAAPMATRHEYLAVLDRIDSPGEFLRTYTERLDSYPVHVKGHPPGMSLVLWALDHLRLGGAGWAAVLVLAGAGLATASVLVAVRSVAGDAAARRAAPFVTLAPAALWLGTSADAFFAGVVAFGAALLIAGRGPASWLAGGVVLGLALLLSYGTVPLLAIPVAVAWWRRDPRPLRALALGVTVVICLAALAGFWWLGGLAATRHFYGVGISRHRPYGLFTLVMNPGALALAIGPAAAAGLGTVRGRAAVLPLAALATVALADLSGLSKGEVERIWLPFVPWLLAATAALPAPRRRAWLAAQVGLAVVLQAALRSPW